MKTVILLFCMLFAYTIPSTAQKLDSYKYFIIEEQNSNNDGNEIIEISKMVTNSLMEKGLKPVKQREVAQWPENENQAIVYVNVIYSQIAYGSYNTIIVFKDSFGNLITTHMGKYRGYRTDGYLSATTMALNDFANYSFSKVHAKQSIGSFTIQPKIGLNMAYVTGTTPAGFNKAPRWGLACGVEFEYTCSRNTSLSLGLLYSMQGVRTSGTIEGVKTTETDKFDYINLPIMANFYVYKGLAFKLGVQPAFRINEGYKVTKEGQSINGKLSDLGYELNTFDFSIPVGLSYEFKNVVVDARYNIGITNINKDDNDSSRNHFLQLTIGYKFKL